MAFLHSIHQQLESAGYAVIPQCLPLEDAVDLAGELGSVASAGRRNVLESPRVRATASRPEIRAIVDEVLGTDAIPVRGILFDKTPDANWAVPWHQDLSIAVTERHDLPGFGPWSVKEGVVHVQPPAEILEGMLTVRIALDPCGPEDGPLLVLPGTHRAGKIPEREIEAHPSGEIPCEVGVGGAVLMRPLVLHASRRATRPSHRRVLHLEFARPSLPSPLRWAFAYFT